MRENQKQPLNPEALRSKLLELLVHFEADLQKEDLRLKVLTLVDAFQYLRISQKSVAWYMIQATLFIKWEAIFFQLSQLCLLQHAVAKNEYNE